MKTSTLIIMLIAAPYAFLVVAAILTPSPDVVSQIAMALMMTVICGILTFIVSRFKSFGQTPESIKRLIVVLVCLLSITTAYSFTSFVGVIYRHRDSSESSESSFEGGGFSFGNLQVEYSLSDEGVTVVCLVDPPQIFSSGDQVDSRKYTFADGNSVEFVIINQQTVWIDKQHRVTFLGPALTKEDVSLMEKHGNDKKSQISSPDELLAVLKELRAEQAASTAPAKATSY